jgi:threonine aldolase
MGSMVVGTHEFITRFNNNREIMGGTLSKPGIFARMGLIALEQTRLEVGEDNAVARTLGKRLEELGWVEVTEKVETNMVFMRIKDGRVNGAELKKFLGEKSIKANISANPQDSNRLAVHHYIRNQQV